MTSRTYAEMESMNFLTAVAIIRRNYPGTTIDMTPLDLDIDWLLLPLCETTDGATCLILINNLDPTVENQVIGITGRN